MPHPCRLSSFLVIAACLVALAPYWASAQQKDKRLAVPDAAAQKQAVERIKSIFPTEYASTNRGVKAKLGQELLQLAQAEKDPTARFALYREAVQIASTAGDVATTFTAIDGMHSDFQINELTVRSFALDNLSKVVQSKEDCILVAEACQGLADLMIADNRFADAKKALASGGNVARKIRGTDHALRLREAAEQIDAIAARFAAVATAAETLTNNPNDPAANLQIGQFECFDKGNWPKGLAHLANGSDATLKKLAEQTLAKPADSDAQYLVAEGWWKASEALKGSSQSRARSYASHWYQESLPGLTGLSKAMAQKRVAEFKPSAGAVASAARGPRVINLLEQIDPDQDFLPKDRWEMQKGLLVCTAGSFVPKVVFPYQPPEEYDMKITFSQPRLRNGVGLILPHPAGGKSFGIGIGADTGRQINLHSPGDRYLRSVDNLIRPDVKYTLVFKVRKAGIGATLNGVAIVNMKTDFSDLRVSDWHRIDDWQKVGLFVDDPAVFYQVELTEITGEGAMTRFPKE